MALRWFALLACCQGCADLLGLRSFGEDGDAMIDMPDQRVQGTYTQRWLENDPGGYPTKMNLPPVTTQLTGSVTLDGGSQRQVMFAPDGTFTFTRATATQRYALEVVTPYVDTIYELDAAAPALVERFAGRLDRVLVPPLTSLAVTVSNAAASAAKEELHTTGVWSRTQITRSGMTGMVFDVDWPQIDGIGGPMGLLDGARHDGFYYAHYTALASYIRLDSTAPVANATLVPMAPTSYTVATTALTTPLCTHLISATMQEEARLAAQLPGSIPVPYWSVEATPDPEFAPTTGFPLAYAGFFAGDADQMAQYANPYPGSTIVARSVVTTALNGTTMQTSTTVPLTVSDCTNPTQVPAGLVAVPTAITLGGMALATGGQVIAIDHTKPVRIEWTPSMPGNADYYLVRLQEPSRAKPIDDLVIVTTQPFATVDPMRLRSGVNYRLEVQAFVGTSNAVNGDFDAVADTTALATVDTTTFVTQ